MSQILQSLYKTLFAGLVLLILVIVIASSVSGQTIQFGHAWGTFVMRWLHVVSGIMWIGLLWYFNFVQIPSMASIPDDQKPAISKVIALIMAFNVWFIIWPNQKKALGMVVVEPAEKAKAARTAMLTSRINTMLSITMLYMMVAQQNGGL